MKRWTWLLAAVLAALLTYTAIGPYLTVRAIRHAVHDEDAAALAKQVDFPELRASLKAQLADRLVRRVGVDAQSSPFGALGLTLANGLVGGAVDAMVTPAGIGAMMEGRKVWDRANNLPPPAHDDDAIRTQPLRDARYRYESLSRFTATVQDAQGRPIVFVLRRHGVSWKLADIRLPL